MVVDIKEYSFQSKQYNKQEKHVFNGSEFLQVNRDASYQDLPGTSPQPLHLGQKIHPISKVNLVQWDRINKSCRQCSIAAPYS
uniref:Uncharacterized protein n=1 Tax=Sphaerodactylus townsendi TaxID=933632 RepID=A0ACB8EGZ1_9SAUR